MNEQDQSSNKYANQFFLIFEFQFFYFEIDCSILKS